MNENILTQDVGFDEKQKILDYARDAFLEIYNIFSSTDANFLFEDIRKSDETYRVWVTTESDKKLEDLAISAKQLKGNFPRIEKITNPSPLATMNNASIDENLALSLDLCLDDFIYSFYIPFKKIKEVPRNLMVCCNKDKEIRLVEAKLNKKDSQIATYIPSSENKGRIYFL